MEQQKKNIENECPCIFNYVEAFSNVIFLDTFYSAFLSILRTYVCRTLNVNTFVENIHCDKTHFQDCFHIVQVYFAILRAAINVQMK